MKLWQKVKKAVLEKVEDGYDWIDYLPTQDRYRIDCKQPSVAYFILGVIMDVLNTENARGVNISLDIQPRGMTYIYLKL